MVNTQDSGRLKRKCKILKKVFEYVDLIARFHSYVMSQMTGDPDSFAYKLGISRSSLYNLISEIRSYGIDIVYSREQETFKYLHPEKVEICVKISQIE